MGTPLPVEVSTQLGLGRHFEIAPVTYTFTKLDLTTTEGVKTVHLVVLEGSNGVQGFAMEAEHLRDFAHTALHAATGLVVASPKGITNHDQ